MTKLLMRTALPDFDESQNQKYRNHLARFQYRNTGHSGDNNRLRTCELGFKPVLEAAQDLAEKAYIATFGILRSKQTSGICKSDMPNQ